MLNHTTSLLQTDFYEVLNEKVKLGFPSSMLDFSQAYSVFQSSLQMQSSDIDKSKNEFLVSKLLYFILKTSLMMILHYLMLINFLIVNISF